MSTPTKVFLFGIVLFILSWGWFFTLWNLPEQANQLQFFIQRDSSDDTTNLSFQFGYYYEAYQESQVYSSDGALDLRGANCITEKDQVQCYDLQNRACPPYVTPLWLNAAPSQYVCSLTGHYCTMDCVGDQVFWYAHTCEPGADCPPYPKTPWQEFYDFDPQAERMKKMGLIKPYKPATPYHYELEAPPPFKEQPKPQNEKKFTWEEKSFTNSLKSKLSSSVKKFLQQHGFNLRGAECEILNNKEVCFVSHRGGRDVCPDYVDSVYLSIAQDHPECVGSNSGYCTVTCQEDTEKVAWNYRNHDWCAIQEDPGACKPIPPSIPYDEFNLQVWKEVKQPIKPCDKLPLSTVANMRKNMAPITAGVLTRGTEFDVLRKTMATYEEGNFFDVIDEFLIMVNQITPEMTNLLKKYKQPPFNVKVLESEHNHGIAKALNWLMGNATNEYFLFLEKDFRLVESYACTVQQFSVGIDLLDTETADVVKYRSRYNAGRPNYAEVIYKTREDAVFHIQPNLLCNFYHWVDRPAQRWPNHFDRCHTHPLFYCVDSKFCNWTNNPILLRVEWWFSNFVYIFDEINTGGSEFNLEGFMNGVGPAWNDAGYIVAEGDGLFKHCDTNNMG